MDNGLLPRRYAKALYKLSTEQGKALTVYHQATQLARAMTGQPAMRQVMGNPFVSLDQKLALVKTAVSPAGADDTLIQDFVKLLDHNHRLDLLTATMLAYGTIYRRANNIYHIDVTSAAPLDQTDRSRLKAMIEQHLGGATAEYEWSTDPALIGGFTVTVDSQKLDASVKAHLQALQQQLLSK